MNEFINGQKGRKITTYSVRNRQATNANNTKKAVANPEVAIPVAMLEAITSFKYDYI